MIIRPDQQQILFGSSGNSVLSGRQLSVPDLRQQAESIVE
jgi:hypothetical protein